MMDNLLGTLIYKITGDSSALDKSLDVSKTKMDRTGASIEKMGSNIMRVSKTIISGMLVKSLLEASSRAEELGSKFNTVFAGVEAQTESWVKKYADATNRGIISTKEFLATQQDLRTGYGDTIESAAEYSKAVVGITNDLASFSNVPVGEAMAAMQSGLSFQFEALRRLGVSVSVATLNQGEYARSLNKTWEQMSNLEKQEAVLSGVVSQSKNALHQEIQLWGDYSYAIGDAALTSQSYANTSQGVKQVTQDLAAELGDALLPAATDILGIALESMKAFNTWSDQSQSLTVSLAALAAVAMTIGGPWGLVLGAVAGATILITSHKDATEKLTAATGDLTTASDEYSGITKQLGGDVSKLSESEVKLLEARKAILGLQIQDNLKDVVSGYDDTSKEIEKYTKSVEKAEAKQAAYSLALVEGPAAVRREKERLASLEKMTSYERSYYENLEHALMQYTLTSDKATIRWEKELKDAVDSVAKEQGNLAENSRALQEAILSSAIAVNSEAVSVEYLALTYPKLYNEIMTTAKGIKAKTVVTEEETKGNKDAVIALTAWQTKLKQLQADRAEEAGEFQRATLLRRQLLAQEKEEAIQKLAVDAKLIQEGEDASSMSIGELRKRIQGNEAAYEEMKAMDISYALESAKIDSDSIQSQQDTSDRIAEMKRSQQESVQEAVASELEGLGKVNEAYEIRKQVLEEGRAAERLILARQVSDKKATQAELDAFDQVSASMQEELLKDKTRTLDAETKASSSLMKEASAQQRATAQQALASYLEGLGWVEASYRIRSQALTEERAEERKALEQKVADKRATQAELDSFDAITRSQEIELEKQKNHTLEAERLKSAEQVKTLLNSQSKDSKQRSIDELEDVGSFKQATAIRISLLEEESNKAISAMRAKVVEKTATQKELDDLESYYLNKSIQLQEEQADKVKAYWTDMLSTVTGTVTGLTNDMAGLFSAITNAQISEIDRQTEAQLEALGLSEDTQLEKLQAEYEAAVESGDMKLAKKKQDAIKRQAIEDEADKKKQALQIEQARREKAMNIFTASIAMLTAIIKAFADPGGWAGVGLAAVAGATGALSIATIAAEPLPSFAVGANYVPEDMLAQIHKGETILPAPMAESVRKGEATFGGSSPTMIVNVMNYTGAEVTQEEKDTSNGKEYTIIIGKAIEKQIGDGRYDKALGNRYGIRRMGNHA